MRIEDIENIYKERALDFEAKEIEVKKRLGLISVLRFLLFILSIASIVFLVRSFSFTNTILSVGLFSTFFALVAYYIKQTDLRNHYRYLITINKEEQEVLNNNYSFFNDGSGYLNRDHPFSYDLDLFGPGSLYQYLNRTFTLVGRDLLAERIQILQTEKKEILGRQRVIEELSEKLDLRQNMMAKAYACPVTNEDNKKIDFWINDPIYFTKKIFFKALVVILPAITLTFLVLLVIGVSNFSWFTLFGIIQLLFASSLLRKTNRQQSMVSEELRILKNYSKLIKLIEEEKFESEILINLQGRLQSNGISAGFAFKKLIKIIDSFDTRLNIFLGVILNATLMWDLLCMMRLERWKLKYGENIKNWVSVIAEYDFYCSVANYRYNNPQFVYPQISEEVIIESSELGHPLIPVKKRVSNNFNIEKSGKIVIITGANMAGKSTFLRTIGVNLIIAMNGMPVCAEKFNFSVMDVFSGMRTADSLKENESYFYAELKRLKYIIEQLKKGRKTFVLLDEILKGTNSVDKAEGSWKFVEHLIVLNATGIIATHDLTLCGLEEKYPQNIKNKCFEVDINGDKISFDYTLHDGVTQNMNASILMRQMKLFSS